MDLRDYLDILRARRALERLHDRLDILLARILQRAERIRMALDQRIHRALRDVVGSQLLWTLPSQNLSPRFLSSHDPPDLGRSPSCCPAPVTKTSATRVLGRQAPGRTGPGRPGTRAREAGNQGRGGGRRGDRVAAGRGAHELFAMSVKRNGLLLARGMTSAIESQPVGGSGERHLSDRTSAGRRGLAVCFISSGSRTLSSDVRIADIVRTVSDMRTLRALSERPVLARARA